MQYALHRSHTYKTTPRQDVHPSKLNHSISQQPGCNSTLVGSRVQNNPHFGSDAAHRRHGSPQQHTQYEQASADSMHQHHLICDAERHATCMPDLHASQI